LNPYGNSFLNCGPQVRVLPGALSVRKAIRQSPPPEDSTVFTHAGCAAPNRSACRRQGSAPKWRKRPLPERDAAVFLYWNALGLDGFARFRAPDRGDPLRWCRVRRVVCGQLLGGEPVQH
jgi:hypothetical protein